MLARDVEAFAAAGYRGAGRRGAPLRARIERDGWPTLRLELVPTGGRVFGGAYALEVSTADPVLPPSSGLRARGRGLVRMHGVTFRPASADPVAERLADRLSAERELQRALTEVHFEEIRVDPDGRAVIRHMGGSLVWLLFPPMTRPIAIGPEQVEATVEALRRFARAGRTASA